VSKILPLPNGDFIFAGDFGSTPPDLADDIFVGRLSKDGEYQWVKPIWAYATGGGRRHHLSIDSQGAINHFFTWNGYYAVVDPLGKNPIKVPSNNLGAVAIFSLNGELIEAKKLTQWPVSPWYP
jgi:hypothetical protein